MSAFTLITMGLLSRVETVTQALDWLIQYDIVLHGMTLLLADADGDMALVEVLPGRRRSVALGTRELTCSGTPTTRCIRDAGGCRRFHLRGPIRTRGIDRE